MKQVILIPGTHAWDGVRKDWYSPGSSFHDFVSTVPDHQLLDDEDPYVWSSRLGGVGFGDDDLVVYRAAGVNLRQYARRAGADPVVLITHSHGLQPALYGCAQGLKVDLLIDVSGPCREDIMPIAALARPNIKRWVHLYGGKRDRWQWLGALFDGKWGVVRKHPLAHENHCERKADHGAMLRDERYQSLIHGLMIGTIHGE